MILGNIVLWWFPIGLVVVFAFYLTKHDKAKKVIEAEDIETFGLAKMTVVYAVLTFIWPIIVVRFLFGRKLYGIIFGLDKK